MTYLRIKTFGKRAYVYRQRSVRDGDSVRTVHVEYVGTLAAAGYLLSLQGVAQVRETEKVIRARKREAKRRKEKREEMRIKKRLSKLKVRATEEWSEADLQAQKAARLEEGKREEARSKSYRP